MKTAKICYFLYLAKLKEKKAELRQLKVEKEEENQKKILAAVAASGKTAEEVIALLENSGRMTEE